VGARVSREHRGMRALLRVRRVPASPHGCRHPRRSASSRRRSWRRRRG
jgi:hypothetical protein